KNRYLLREDRLVTCFDTTKSYRSKFAFNPIYRIENRFPALQSILDKFGVSSIKEISVWGIDPARSTRQQFIGSCGPISLQLTPMWRRMMTLNRNTNATTKHPPTASSLLVWKPRIWS
ncbi:hypothetical protein EC957_007549, partial [Mortierella hygrophila]